MRWLIIIATVMSCRAQSQAFEVASVKLNRSGSDRGGISLLPGRITVSNMTLKGLVRYAYDVRDIQILGGPACFDSDRWDIAATAGGAISDDERRQMLRALLGERFELTVRRDRKDLPVYALTQSNNGSRLKPNTDGRRPRVAMGATETGLLQLVGEDVPVSRLAIVLAGSAGRIVIDRTGIEGNFDFKLEWVPDATNVPSINGARMETTADGPPLFTAVQEQLGLRLEATKGPVEILVIERAEKAVAN
jgi:uncharacterized protein (TIGR03435 family)